MTAWLHRSAASPDTRSREPLPRAAASAAPLIRRGLLATTALLPVALLAVPARAQAPNAAPSGGQVSAGAAAISRAGTTTTINQGSARAAIDWQRFDVGRDHTVRFNQPNTQSWTLNRVNTPDPSLIAGRIQANGGVAIVNQSGVVFAPGAQVNVGSLIASAAGITNQNFMTGRMVFDQPARPGARVENHGSITVAERGLASLVAPGVANSGLIQARLGRVALAGAETFTLDLAGDGLVSLDVTQSVRQAPQGNVALVTNSGTIEAAGGSVLLTADAARGVVDTMLRNTGRVNVDGDATAPAGSVALRGGAGGDVRVDAGSISATGTAPGARGGNVQVTSAGGSVSVAPGARLDASGAGGGGAVRVGGGETARATVAGEVTSRGTGARVGGGLVTVQAKEAVEVLAGAKLDASGTGGGGTVLAGTTGVGRAQAMSARTTVQAGAELRADATAAGNGGLIVVNSAERTEVRGLLSARGGPQAGDGGFIELSGQYGLYLSADVRLDAPAGQGGTVLIDPDTINLQDSGAAGQPPVGGSILFADGGTGTINVDVDAINSFTAGVNVLLQANNTINVKAEVNRATAGSVFLETQNTGTINVDADMRAQNGGLGFRTGTLALDNVTLNASTDISVSTDTLSTKNGVTLNAPTLSLRADTFTFTDSNVLSGSTLVEIGPRSVGTVASSYVPANSVTITTALLRLGRTAAGNRLFGAPDDVEVTADDLVLTTTITRANTNVELFATDSVQLEAPISIGTGQLALRTTDAAGTVTQDPSGAAITAGGLSGAAGSGGFSAADPANALGTLGAITSTGDVTIRSAGNLSVVGAVAGGSAGTVRISAAGTLDVAATGSVAAGDIGDTGTVNLWGSSITLAGPVSAETVTLAASSDADTFVAGGSVTQSGAGTLRAGTLGVLAGGDVTLALATSRILNVGSESFGTGTTAIRSDQAMTVTTTPPSVPHPDGSGPTTPTAGITTDGDVRLAAPTLNIDAALVANGDATRSVTLVADAFTFGAPALIQPGTAPTPGTVTITRFTDGVIDVGGAGAIAGALEITIAELNAIAFASRLRIGGGVSAATLQPSGASGSSATVTAPLDMTALSIGTLDLRGTGVTQAAAGAGITVARLESTTAAGGLLLDGADNVITTIGDVTAGGSSTLRVDAGLSLDGAIDLGTNTLNLRTDGAVTQPGGTVTAALDIRGATGASAGAITLEQVNELSAVSADSAAAISVRSERAAGLSIGPVSGATDIRIFANDSGSGAVSVDGAVVSTSAGTVRIETPAPLSVAATGSVTSGSLGGADAGNVHLWGQSIALAGPVDAGSQVSLSAAAGNIDDAFGAALPATVTQSGAGLVSTRRLALNVAGDTTLALDNQVDQVGAITDGSVALRSLRNLAIAAGLSIPRADGIGSVSTGTGVRSLSGSISLSAPTVTIDNPVTADAGDIALTAFGPGSTITIAAGVALTASAANRSITLIADSFDLQAGSAITANAGSGTVILQTFTDATNLLLDATSGHDLVTAETLSVRSLGGDGTPVPGAVQISGALAFTTVGVLDMQGASVSQAVGGTLQVGALTGAASAGDFIVNRAGNQIGTLGATSAAGGVVRVASDTALTVSGVVTGSAGVDLTGLGLAVDATVTASGGDLALVATNGSIDINAAVVATVGDVSLTAALGGIQIDAAVTAGNDITLLAANDIGQSAPGVLSANAGAGALAATSNTASVALAAANNLVGTVTGDASGDFNLLAASALTAGPVTALGSIGLTGTALTVADVLTATGSVAITATTGSVQVNAAVNGNTGIALSAQTNIAQAAGGTLNAGGGVNALSAVATTGEVALTLADNQIGAVSGTAGTDFAVRSITGLTVNAVATEAVSITGPGLTVNGTVTATDGNAVLTASTGSIDINAAVSAAAATRTVTLSANSGGIQLDAGVTAGAGLTLSALNDISQTAPGVLNAGNGTGTLTADSNSGSVFLTAAGNRVGTVSGSALGGFLFNNADALTIGAVSAVLGAVQITGPSLTVTGPVESTADDILLTATTGSIDVNGAVTSVPGTVALAAASGGIQIDATVTGGSGITLTAASDIAQSAPGVLTAGGATGPLSATSSAGAVALTAANNAMGGVSGSGATGFAFRNTVAMAAGPVTATTGDVLLVAPTLSVSGAVQAAADNAAVTLVADVLALGANTVSAGSVGQPGRVTITRLTDGTLAIGGANAAGVTAVSLMGIQRASTLQVGGGFNAGTATVSGNGNHAITLAGASSLLGRAGTLELLGTGISQNSGTLAVDALRGTATTGDFLMDLAGNDIDTLGPVTAAAGAVRVTSGSTLTVAGDITAQDAIALTAAGLVVNAALDVTAGDLSLAATSGNLVLNTAVEAPGGDVNLTASAGDLQVAAGVTAGDGISLVALNDISQTLAGVLSANGGTGALLAQATTGAVALTVADNLVGSVSGGSGGAFAVRSTSGLAVGTVTAGGGVTIIGPAITVNGSVLASTGDIALTAQSGAVDVDASVTATAGAVGLTASSGGVAIDAPVTAGTGITLAALADIQQTAPGVLTAGAPGLQANAGGGAVSLTNADNQVSAVAGTATGTFALRSVAVLDIGAVTGGTGVAITGLGVTVTGPIAATTGNVGLTATGGDVDVNGAVTATAGSVNATAASGSIQVGAAMTAQTAMTLSARDGIAQSAPGVLAVAGGAGALQASASAGSVALTAASNQLGVVRGSAGAGNFSVSSVTGLEIGAVTASGLVGITGPALTFSGAVIADTGNIALTATTGGIAVTQAVTATAGAVGLTANAGGIQIDAGVTSGAGITLAAQDDIGQSAPGVLTANAGIGSLMATTTAGAVALTLADNVIGGIAGSAGAGFAMRSIAGLEVGAVTAGGPVAITGLVLTVSSAVAASTGDVTLTATTGDLDVNATVTATAGDATLSAGSGSIQLEAAVTAGADIALSAGTGIAQGTTGVLSANGGAGALQADAAAGGVALATADNLVGSVAGSANGDFVFRSIAGLTVGAVTASGSVSITGPSLTVTGPMAATGGDLTLISGADLAVNGAASANGAVLLSAASGRIDTTAAVTAGADATLTSRDGIAVGGALAATAGDVALTATAGGITTTATVTAGADVTLTASGDIALGGALAAAGGSVDLTSTLGGIITITTTTTAAVGDVDLTSAAGGVTTVAVTAGRDATLTASDTIAVNDALAAAGNVELTSTGGGITTTAAVTAGGDATLIASGDIAVGGALAAAGNVELTSTAGGITTTAAVTAGTMATLTASGDIAVGGALTASAAGLQITSTQGAIQLDAPATAATDIALRALSDIAQGAAGRLSVNSGGGGLTVNAASGSVELAAADNEASTITGSAAGGFAFRGVTALTVNAITANGGDLTIRTAGAPILLNGPLDASGGIAVTSGGNLTLPGTTVLARGGDAELRSAGDLTATDATVASPGTITLAADGSGAMLRLIGGTYTAEYMVLTAGPAGDGTATASFSGGTFQLGTAMLVAAGGGVGLATDLPATVTPQNSGALPLLFFDTRRTPSALRALDPTVFAPATRDDPALQPNDQIWQVFNPRRSLPGNARLVGFADGSGLATSAPAGELIVNLEAGESGVFFLLDGGTATGTIIAGRLGVHGQPSALRLPGDLVVDLTGELGGISGSAAARFGRVATGDPADQGRYRFDNCVLDTINCVVPSLAQPVVLPLSNRIDIRSDAPQLDPDVLLPNIAEEDY